MHRRPENVAAARQNVANCGFDFLAEELILKLDIVKKHGLSIDGCAHLRRNEAEQCRNNFELIDGK
jgi:hypothetical protein